ncbi:hypothetical protein VNO77_44345 [Canavalia gladiata]|uniref:Uncharacterized protein n=1 Tax=Canavalia gladiata TaxID=3824 RepID=A0AAN9JYD5_CANGL
MSAQSTMLETIPEDVESVDLENFGCQKIMAKIFPSPEVYDSDLLEFVELHQTLRPAPRPRVFSGLRIRSSTNAMSFSFSDMGWPNSEKKTERDRES